MPSLNQITLIGRLTADPELRYTQSGTAVASFTLAVDRELKNKDGSRDTDFVNVVVWQKLGELCAHYLRKGRLAGVVGRLQIRQYENRDGQKVRVAEVVADKVQFLDRAPEGTGNGSAASTFVPSGSGAKPSGTSQAHVPAATALADDPWATDGKTVDIVDDDLPF